MNKHSFRLAIFFIIMAFSSCVAMGPVEQPRVRVKDPHGGDIKRMNFSPSGKYLVSAGYRMAVKIWAVPDLKPLQTFKAHQNTSRGIA